MSVPRIEDLSSVPIFASLTRTELRAAARLFTVRSYQKNAIVATEGDRVDFFNLVLSGEVQAFWRDEAGHQLKLGVDGPGAHFPDVALGGEPAQVSHIAVTDLRLALIRMVDMAGCCGAIRR